MADEPTKNQGDNEQDQGSGGSQMPGRNPQGSQDMGEREGAGAHGDAADRAEVDRLDLNNQSVE